MSKHYFTFGQCHTHRYDSITLDCDSVVEIEARDGHQAREKMFELFGAKWGFQYTEDTYDQEYFPRGVVLRLEA